MVETDITRLLAEARDGEPERLGAVFEALYPELLRMARSRMRGHDITLSPTVLVHELFLRVTGGGNLVLADRRHFFAAAAQALRWIMVENARSGAAQKRGGGLAHVELDDQIPAAAVADTGILALHEGLEALQAISPQRRQVVELRYFGGLEFSEVAALLEISERTAQREWERARAFLQAFLDDEHGV